MAATHSRFCPQFGAPVIWLPQVRMLVKTTQLYPPRWMGLNVGSKERSWSAGLGAESVSVVKRTGAEPVVLWIHRAPVSTVAALHVSE